MAADFIEYKLGENNVERHELLQALLTDEKVYGSVVHIVSKVSRVGERVYAGKAGHIEKIEGVFYVNNRPAGHQAGGALCKAEEVAQRLAR